MLFYPCCNPPFLSVVSAHPSSSDWPLTLCATSPFVKGEDGEPAGEGGPVLSANGPQLSRLSHRHRFPGVGDRGGGVRERQGKSSARLLLLRVILWHASLLRAGRPLKSAKTRWHELSFILKLINLLTSILLPFTGWHGFESAWVWYCWGGKRSVFTRRLWNICYKGGQRKCCRWKVKVRASSRSYRTSLFFFNSLLNASSSIFFVLQEWTIGCWRLMTWTWRIRTGSRWWRLSLMVEDWSTWWYEEENLWEEGSSLLFTSTSWDTKVHQSAKLLACL